MHGIPWTRDLLWRRLHCGNLLEEIFDETVVEVDVVVVAVLVVEALMTLGERSSVGTALGFEHVIAKGHGEPVFVSKIN